MKKYRVFDIVWDIDSEPWTLTPDLPSEVPIEVGDDFDPVEEAADYVSDDWGWCIKSCSFEEIN